MDILQGSKADSTAFIQINIKPEKSADSAGFKTIIPYKAVIIGLCYLAVIIGLHKGRNFGLEPVFSYPVYLTSLKRRAKKSLT